MHAISLRLLHSLPHIILLHFIWFNHKIGISEGHPNLILLIATWGDIDVFGTFTEVVDMHLLPRLRRRPPISQTIPQHILQLWWIFLAPLIYLNLLTIIIWFMFCIIIILTIQSCLEYHRTFMLRIVLNEGCRVDVETGILIIVYYRMHLFLRGDNWLTANAHYNIRSLILSEKLASHVIGLPYFQLRLIIYNIPISKRTLLFFKLKVLLVPIRNNCINNRLSIAMFWLLADGDIISVHLISFIICIILLRFFHLFHYLLYKFFFLFFSFILMLALEELRRNLACFLIWRRNLTL